MKKYEYGEQMSDFQELWIVVGERVGVCDYRVQRKSVRRCQSSVP